MALPLSHERFLEAERALWQQGFLLRNEIGSGGFAVVHEVQARKYEGVTNFVVKIVDRSVEDDALMDSFAAEVSALSVLLHPNVIQFFNFFHSESFLYIVLEHCPGGSVRDLIVRQGPIPFPQLQPFASQLVSALHFCHGKNIAHRDIKPSNILIDKYGRAKLADFGLALLIIRCEFISSHVGSLAYIAPELIRGQPFDPLRTDIWALGVTFYEMATGMLPWESGNTEGMKEEIIEGRFASPPNVPDDFVQAIAQMLNVDPQMRPTPADLAKMEVFQECPWEFTPMAKRRGSAIRGMTGMALRQTKRSSTVRLLGRKRSPHSTFVSVPGFAHGVDKNMDSIPED
jgi:serine/threonine protein kinase